MLTRKNQIIKGKVIHNFVSNYRFHDSTYNTSLKPTNKPEDITNLMVDESRT